MNGPSTAQPKGCVVLKLAERSRGEFAVELEAMVWRMTRANDRECRAFVARHGELPQPRRLSEP